MQLWLDTFNVWSLESFCCSSVYSRWSWRIFKRCVLPQSSGRWSHWWSRQYAPLKRLSTLTWLHGATSQKTLNSILAAVRTWNLTPSVYVFIKVRDHVTHPYKTSNFLYIKKIIRLLDKKFSISTYNIVSHRVQTWATFTNNRPINK
jgi:hypothetical protein